LQHLAAPLHRCPDLDQLQHGVIVFRITDSYRVVRRQAKHVERRLQSSRLCDTLRQYHDAAAVERQHERQLPLPDDIEDLKGVARGAVNET
jgi:hypothetical protein